MLDELWQRRRRSVEERLSFELERTPSLNRTLFDAMEYSLLSGGKRLRPILLMAAADAVDGSGEKFLTTAAAIEMIH
ncbi:MAG: polyprenyl synthetase family protein, partial [Selenomonadaceae bacterium]|nr:polyprenyl synthetase family protein [Selenomonadaceae bacterium]